MYVYMYTYIHIVCYLLLKYSLRFYLLLFESSRRVVCALEWLHLSYSSRGGLDGGGIHSATPQHAAAYCSTLENTGLIQMTTKYVVLICISPIFSIFSTHGKFCMSSLFSIFSIYGKFISLICMSPIISIFSTHEKHIPLI